MPRGEAVARHSIASPPDRAAWRGRIGGIMKDEDQDTSCDEGPARAAARRLPRRHWATLRPARRGRPAAGHVRSESGETRRRRTAVYV